MNITAIALPAHLHKSVSAAYPEHDWTFVPSSEKRRFFGLGPRRSVIPAAGICVLWSEDGDIAGRAEALRGVEVMVLHPGPVSPEMSPHCAPATDLCSFMLLPARTQAPQGKDGASLLLPDALMEMQSARSAQRARGAAGDTAASHGTVSFVTPDTAVETVLDTLPAGYVLKTAGGDLDIAQQVALHRRQISILPAGTGLAQGLAVATSVMTADAMVAILARQMGKHVIAACADSAPLRAALEAGGASAEALLADHTRFVDTRTNAPVPFAKVCARVAMMLFPVPQEGTAPPPAALPPYESIEADAKLCLVVGAPDGIKAPASALFGRSDVLQAPASFTAQALLDRREAFEGQDLVIWQQMPGADWIRNSTGTVRMLSRYPVGMPMHLARDTGFWPVLACERLRGQTGEDGAFTIHFDLAADLDALDPATQQHLRDTGIRMLPDLMRLQSNWRLHRHGLFAMTRKLGLQEGPRLVVLGCAPAQDGVPVQTNPDRIDDVQLVARLLETHPGAQIVYQPHDTQAADKTLLAGIAGLSEQVTLIEADYEVSELALVCDAFHTVDSPFGLTAVLSGKPVSVYGTPSYGGLGLTRDLDAAGNTRPLLVTHAVDLPLFAGWHFTRNIIFVDPVTGARVPATDYAATWFPLRGEMTDAQAARMRARALNSPDLPFRDAILHLLQMQGKHDQTRALLDGLDPGAEIATRPAGALAMAEAHAGLGDWRHALQIAARVSEHHRADVTGMVADAIARIRTRLRSFEDRAAFAQTLLALFHKTPVADIEKIAHTLMDKRYFRDALLLFQTLRPSNRILAAICRCQIGLSDPEAAQTTRARLVAGRLAKAQIEDLTLALDEMTGDWNSVADVLAQRMRRTPDMPTLALRHAEACVQAGRYDAAHDSFVALMGTAQQAAAIRGLSALEITRMNIPAARSLLETHLAGATPDKALYSLMGECLGFENNLAEACEYYFRALRLNALDTPSYARLRELEKELEAQGCAPDVLWSARFKALVAQAGDDTVETLLGEGRLGLLDNDTDTLRANTARAVALFPNDMRAYAWWGHAMAWTPGQRSAQEVQQIIAYYHGAIAAGTDDGWWPTHDCIRSMVVLGQTDELRKLLAEQHRIIFIGQKARTGWPRFLAGAALADLKLAFEGLRDYPRAALLRKHARNFRVTDSIDEIKPGEKVLFLSEGGVGDEIRYAIAYPELAARFPDAVFSVDARLAPLFRRSFPQVARFVPLPRFHRTRVNRDLLPHIGNLPDQGLAQFFDNTLWAAAQDVDVVISVTSVMADLRPDAAAFDIPPRPRLTPDPDRIRAWRARLQPHADTLLVGVIGTSRILEYQRVANYFTPDEMGDMYRLPGITFVSLEYNHDEKLAADIRSRFGAAYLSFEDLDRMDDFDGVLALAHALDCVVGVNTATIELTAFGGVDTLFAAPNATHIWRDPKGTGEELFFDTMEIVLGRGGSGKQQVTARIAALLEARRDTKPSTKTAGS